MDHLDFIVWMIAWPIGRAIVRLIESKYCTKEYPKDVRGLTALIIVATWYGVGYLLF